MPILGGQNNKLNFNSIPCFSLHNQSPGPLLCLVIASNPVEAFVELSHTFNVLGVTYWAVYVNQPDRICNEKLFP